MANPVTTVKLNSHSIRLPADVVDTYLSDWDLEEPLDGKLSKEAKNVIQGYRLLTISMRNDEVMQVPIQVLNKLGVIRMLIEDMDDIPEEQPIPVAIDKRTMDYIVALFPHDDRLEVKDPDHANRLERYILKASEAFAPMPDLSVATELIRNANYLDYPPLIDAAAAFIGESLLDKSKHDIRGAFGITREFTDAERRAVIDDFPELSEDSDMPLNRMRAECV
jgi:hypothetical protein